MTQLACYELTNRSVTVDHDGLVRREKLGQTTVIVRFLTQQLPVRLAFLPARPNFAWQAPPAVNYIDELTFAQLRKLRMNPSPVCDDTTFLRRAYLDAIGLLPTADEARAFAADPSPDKRARLIDDLLARPEFAEHWALKWADVLRNEEKVLDAKGVDAFYALDSRLDRRPASRWTSLSASWSRPAAARTTIRPPISIGPIAIR